MTCCPRKIALIVFLVLAAAVAEDAIFRDAKLSRLDSNQEPKVDMTLPDTGFTVRSSTASPSPLAGISVMHTKTKSHRLMLDYQEKGVSKNLVLRLHKSDYKKVLDVMEAKSGKPPDSGIKDHRS